MTELKTKEATLQALQRASGKLPTPEQINKQRVSFIMGSLNKDSNVTRAKVQELLAQHEGVKIKK